MRLTLLILIVVALPASAQFNVTTFAGNGQAGHADGPLASARFDGPFGMCRDAVGNFYIADGGNNVIRKIDPSGVVSTFAGDGFAGYRDGAADTAQFNEPINVCVDGDGNVYVSDFLNHRIRKIDTAGIVTTIAGSGIDGFRDGQADSAQFNYPRGIGIDASGNIYIGDSWNHRIRKIEAVTGDVSTYAGNAIAIGVGSAGDWIDAADTAARFWTPSGLSIDEQNRIYVADPFNHRIRMIDTARNVTTVAGSGAIGPNNGGFADGDATTLAILNTPTEVFFGKTGRLLIGDTFGNRVRSLDSTGTTVSTIAGTGLAGFANGADTVAEFDFPRGLFSDDSGDSIYLIDHNNNAVRLLVKVEPDTPTAISEPRAVAFSLFPNPANDRLLVEFQDSEVEQLVIIDSAGRVILEVDTRNSQKVQVDLKQMSPGTHFAVARINGRSSTMTFDIVR